MKRATTLSETRERAARRPHRCALGGALVLGAGLAVGLGAAESADLEARLRDGRELLASGSFAEAARVFRAADKQAGGGCAPCQLGVAKASNGLGDSKAALKSVEALLASTDDAMLQGIAYNERGLALIAAAGKDEKNLEQAEAAFRKAHELTGTELAQFNLGVTLLKLGRDGEGVAVLSNFLAAHADSPRAESARDLVDNPLRARKRLLPNVELVTLAGERITPDQLLGKVVLLDFWGTWCGPCRRSVPSLRRLSKRMEKDPFLIVGIANDPDEAVVRRFLAENEMTWPQVLDSERKVVDRMGVRSYPTYMLVAHDGEIVFTETGWSEAIEREVAMRVGRALKALEKSAKKAG